MRMVTRCPRCGTAFRVVASQLAVRDGHVRCGQCTTVFDARATLVADAEAVALEAQGPVSVASAPVAPHDVEIAQVEAAVSQPLDSRPLEPEISLAEPDSDFEFGPQTRRGARIRTALWAVASLAAAAALGAQVVHFVNKAMPGNLPKKTARALLGVEDAKVVPIVRDPAKVTEDSDAVFYFPGCGSERLFSQVGLATQAMLYEIGAQCVLPPGYLCCGYPQTAAGEEEKGERIITTNRVLFHRLATTLNYLDIRTVIVSCGTCLDQLEKYEFDKIFPGSRLLDIHEYLLEKGVKLDNVPGVRYLYHDPCHTPMKVHAPLEVARQLTGADVRLSARCCGESGTLAVTRPDISTQVRFRKEEELRRDVASLGGDGPLKVLTSCPSCLQGLARFEADSGAQADYIVVEMARRLLGEDWLPAFVAKANAGGIERVLL